MVEAGVLDVGQTIAACVRASRESPASYVRSSIGVIDEYVTSQEAETGSHKQMDTWHSTIGRGVIAHGAEMRRREDVQRWMKRMDA